MSAKLNLTQTDIITRLRRWAGVVGLASPQADDSVVLDVTAANLAVDPYQQENDEFFGLISSGASAGNFSFAGITNGGTDKGAALVLVDRVDFWSATAVGFSINLQRAQASSSGSSWAIANINTYNEGNPKGFPSGRQASGTSVLTLQAASPFGQVVYNNPAVAANTLTTWIPPYPMQLYPSPGTPTNFGDVLYVAGLTANVGIFAIFHWREWSNFRF